MRYLRGLFSKLRLYGSAAVIVTVTAPPPERLGIVQYENRFARVARENRSGKVAAENRIGRVKP